ncbi:flagellar hook-length control protein FliK [Sphingomonas sp. Sphisp140]|uniref:flagellar hook-length control protein FliK n=1 Tax=unclassified Sphingomonas TaxID=196159 RepID=UPI0039B0E81C
MQINNIGFAGLLGAGGANPGDAGTGFAQTLGLMLGAPSPMGTPAKLAVPATGATPTAANDALAPATSLSMAQLLTTAAPAAIATAPATETATAMPAPAADALPETLVPAAPTAQTPVDALPVTAEEPAAALPATPDKPVVATPPFEAKPAKPGKPAAAVQPDPATQGTLPSPAEPAAEVKAEAPAEEPKAPVKRGPRLAGDDAALPPADTAMIPADTPAVDMVAVAVTQAPVQPEVAVKPQPSTTRQFGDVSTGTRKADAKLASADAKGAEPTVNDKLEAATSAIAGKSGQKNDNAAGDERGQAPAFTLRQDSAAVPTPTHHATEAARTQAAPAVAAAEPVIAARPGHLGQQMGVEIARKVEAGEDTLRVRLSPDNLGKVEVTLSFDDSGKMHATVRAESQHALDLLRQDAPDLGRALDQAGIRSDAQSFRFESRGEGSNAQAQQQQGQNNRGGQFAGNDESETAQPAYREIRGDGQVDLLA